MARSVLFVVKSDPGHVLSFLGVAKRLEAAGCEVAFFTCPSDVSPVLARNELRARCYFATPEGVEEAPTSHAAQRAWAEKMKTASSRWFVRFIDDYATRRLAPVVNALRSTIRKLKPDVVCLDCNQSYAAIAAELERVPWITASLDLHPLAPDTLHFPYLDRNRDGDATLAVVARRYGAEVQFRASHPVSPFGNVVFATEHLMAGSLWDSTELIGPVTWQQIQRQDRPPFPWERIRAGVPLIYVGSSTVTPFEDTLVAGIVRSLEGISCQVVLEAASCDPAFISTLPEWLLPISYSARSVVLERAALMISHGGAATAYEALAAGCPQLLIPQAFEQPLQAWLVEQNGFGRGCDPFDVERCRKAVLALIDPDAPERRRAREVAPALRDCDGSLRLAELLQAPSFEREQLQHP